MAESHKCEPNADWNCAVDITETRTKQANSAQNILITDPPALAYLTGIEIERHGRRIGIEGDSALDIASSVLTVGNNIRSVVSNALTVLANALSVANTTLTVGSGGGSLIIIHTILLVSRDDLTFPKITLSTADHILIIVDTTLIIADTALTGFESAITVAEAMEKCVACVGWTGDGFHDSRAPPMR